MQQLPKSEAEAIWDAIEMNSNRMTKLEDVHDDLSDRIEEATARGFKKVLIDPSTWDSIFDVLGNKAQERAGKATLGFIWTIFRKFIFFIAAGLMIYYFGGWSALMAWVKITHP